MSHFSKLTIEMTWTFFGLHIYRRCADVHTKDSCSELLTWGQLPGFHI